MQAMFDQYSSRPEFVKSLRNRLREMKRLSYNGTLMAGGGTPLSTEISKFPIDFDWDDSARAALLSKLQKPINI
jgi:hypothetical protein